MDDSLATKSSLSGRLLRLAITAGVLYLVFRRIDLSALAESFARMRPGWFVAAVLTFAAALLSSAARWHVVFRLVKAALHLGATIRMMFIGHFFYMIFFGAAAGDIARSTLYSKWYRFPLEKIIVSVSLDRLSGFVGLLLLTLSAFVLAASDGEILSEHALGFEMPRLWIIGLAVCVVAAAIFIARQIGTDSFWARAIREIVKGFRGLLAAPHLAGQAVGAGLMMHVFLSGTMALNLQAVSSGAIAWQELFWVFPLVFVISALPFTISGLGLREGAAMALLGLYGVPASDAVAAALLTFAASLVWAATGGVVFWREQKRIRVAKEPPLPESISVVIPTLNEELALPETLRRLRDIPEVREVIVVDGGSRDATRRVAEESDCRVLSSEPGRGFQLRAGAELASGDVVLLLHADTWLPPQAGEVLINTLRDPGIVGGGFWKVFRERRFLLRGSRWKCAVRLFLGKRIAGDQAMFVRRAVLERAGGVPAVPLMEEFELCRALRKAGRLALADATVTTSARRFIDGGILRTYARMWRIMIRYYLGASPQDLRRIYDRK